MPDAAAQRPEPDLTGKVVLVTGGNSGIGKEAAADLAAMGATVVLAARDPARGDAARREIAARHPPAAPVAVMQVDLASLASVRAFAAAFRDRFDRLDVLLLNAGLVLRRRAETAEGFETTFAVNHLGHFLLTQLLLERVVASAPARIVVVSSGAHRQARHGLDFDDLQSTRRYRAFEVYAKSKLANIYFARELARRLDGGGVTVNALHPGFVATNFAKDGDTGLLGQIAMRVGRPFALSAHDGARTSVFLCSDASLEGVTGGYWYRRAQTQPSRAALDDGAARHLWDVSERLVASPAPG